MASKFDKAVKRARGEDIEETALARTDAPQTLGALGSDGVASLVRRADAQTLADRMRSGEIEAAPQLLTLEDGTEITARVLKSGTTEVESLNQPGVMETKTNWHLQLLDPETYAPGPRVSILGSAQLDRQLAEVVGKVAIIARGGTIKTKKGRQMTEYFVAEVKRTGSGVSV